MMDAFPKLVDECIKKILKTRVPLHVAQGLILEREKSQADVEKIIVDAIQKERENLRLEISSQLNDAIAIQDDPHDDAHPEGENSAKRHKTSEHGTFELGGSSSGQVYESELGSSTSSIQEQTNNFDLRMNSYAIDDDVIPNEKVSQELMDEMSQTVDEVKLRKKVDEMLRQQCTLGDEHQYYIDQMQNFLKNDIMWESRKEILVPPFQPKPTPVIQSCQRDLKAPAMTLVNQDLFYLKKGNSKKIALSLHKFPAVNFPDDDIEERTFRWQEPGKPKEEIYSNSKIVQIIKTYWELGHEHKFIIEIIIRRANGRIVSITESDYKNLNKNDIEDMYMLIINHKVDDYAETGLLWSLPVFIRSTVIWERVHDFQLGVESYQ
ncbi:hypothetical protein Tco_1196759 [Tanacetum coccineum]